MARAKRDERGDQPLKDNRYIVVFKYAWYATVLLVLFVLQTTPLLFEVYGIKPNLVFGAAICIAMFEGEFTGGLFGAFAGLLCDFGSYTAFGFNGILLLMLCTATGLLTVYLIKQRLFNVLWMTAAGALFKSLIEYFFYYSVYGYEGVYRVLLYKMLPTAGFTVAGTAVIYFIIKRIKLHYDEILKVT